MSAQLTPNDFKISRIVAGMMNLSAWRMSTPELVNWIHACLEMGITTFDHADIYGGYTCESVFGQALAAEPGLRDKMQLVSKCGIQLVTGNRPANRVHHYDTSAAHIVASAEQSLRNLHTDYLDVLLIHRPDPLLDADEVAAAFAQLRQAGKVRHVGVSNFTPWQFDLLASRLDFPLVTNQIEFSVMHLDPLHDGSLDQCQQHHVVPMAWGPLGGGELFHADIPRAHRLRGKLTEICEEVGDMGIDQVAIAWLLTHPAGVVPVLGTGKLERLRSAVAAQSIQLTRQQWFAIWEASAGREVP
ncbi:MAG: aldo/keto reductase [Chloroflexota bacterium]|nr:aldo/keto reductase [Ardenticatenaceae bacterium]